MNMLKSAVVVMSFLVAGTALAKPMTTTINNGDGTTTTVSTEGGWTTTTSGGTTEHTQDGHGKAVDRAKNGNDQSR